MVKRKFGASVRAKTPVAQVNEALLKFLAHSIVVVIASTYELGIEPEFWGARDCLKSHGAAPKCASTSGDLRQSPVRGARGKRLVPGRTQ